MWGCVFDDVHWYIGFLYILYIGICTLVFYTKSKVEFNLEVFWLLVYFHVFLHTLILINDFLVRTQSNKRERKPTKEIAVKTVVLKIMKQGNQILIYHKYTFDQWIVGLVPHVTQAIIKLISLEKFELSFRSNTNT